jgi:hypothetical protein
MSIKGQLSASREYLMAGMRSAGRGATPNAQAEKLLRACLDLIEAMVRAPEAVMMSDVETTLAVLHQSAAELEDETHPNNAIVAAIQNAIGKMQQLRVELAEKPLK